MKAVARVVVGLSQSKERKKSKIDQDPSWWDNGYNRWDETEFTRRFEYLGTHLNIF